jgi:hypothetical protein
MQQPASSGGLDGVIPLNHPYHPYPRGIELERGRERGEERERGRERISIYIYYIYVFPWFFFNFFSESFRNLFTLITLKGTLQQ